MALKYCPRCHSPISVEYESDICPTCGCPIYGDDKFNDREIVSLDEIDEKRYFLRKDLPVLTADSSKDLTDDPETDTPAAKDPQPEPPPKDPPEDPPEETSDEKPAQDDTADTGSPAEPPEKNHLLSILRRVLFIVIALNILVAVILFFFSHREKKPVTVDEILKAEQSADASEPLKDLYGNMKPVDSIEKIISDHLPVLENCIHMKIMVWNNYITGAIDKSTDPYIRPDGEFIKDLSVVLDNLDQSDPFSFDKMKLNEAVDLMDELMELYRSAPTDTESDRDTILKYETFKNAVNLLTSETKSFDTFKNVETLALDTLKKLP